MKPEFHCDIAIAGGGIAGLWLSSVLNQAGFYTILLESDALGAGQTLAAQGIIHGGTKYALTGKLTGSSEAVRAMPARWRTHLSGERFPNLNQVKVNTHHQWMWSADSIGAKIAGFLASKLMTSRVHEVAVDQLPAMLAGKTVYQLDEPVLDVANLLQILSEQSQGHIYQGRVDAANETGANGIQMHVESCGEALQLRAQLLICTAGAGNERLTPDIEMQRRGLHMVMVKGQLPSIWAHIVEADATPRMTITTHGTGDQVIWYLGGKLAEAGVEREHEEQLRYARSELESLLPDVDWANMLWSAFRVDRAEGKQAGGARPDIPVMKCQGRRIVVWPTKLAFAPLVADQVMSMIESLKISPAGKTVSMPDLNPAQIGMYPWDKAIWTRLND